MPIEFGDRLLGIFGPSGTKVDTSSDFSLRLGEGALDSFTFQQKRNFLEKRLFGKKNNRGLKTISKTKTFKAVSQEDFLKLASFDGFDSRNAKDITNTKESSASFVQNRKTGNVFQTGGVELSSLDEEGLERVAEVFSGRVAQINSAGLTPGLEQQSFSLLSGNFS